jgi:hypothetical protein
VHVQEGALCCACLHAWVIQRLAQAAQQLRQRPGAEEIAELGRKRPELLHKRRIELACNSK